MMGRRSILGALAGSAAVMLGGCGNGKLTPAEELERMVEASTSDKAMWYRFTFAGEYQGKLFRIDQMVTCVRSVQSGGSLGQSPAAVANEGYPKTAAAKMADNSQVLVRIPNMCSRHRAYVYRPNTIRVTYRHGWRSRGPHEIIPLVIWTDDPMTPNRIESYVAREYYRHPQARIKNPIGMVDLWPVGQFPKNVEAILKAKEPIPYHPHPNINPKRDPNGRGKGNDGSYHGTGPRFVTSQIIPISDPIAGWAKYSDAANAKIAEAARKTRLPLSEKPYEDENFVVYPDIQFQDIVGQYGPAADYIWGACLQKSLADLMTGNPVIMGPTLQLDILGDPKEVNARTPGTDAYKAGWLPDVELTEQKMRNCNAQLGALRSFDVIDGRFDSSRSLPGMLVYGRWGIDPFPASMFNAGPYSALSKMNLINKSRVFFHINGRQIVLPLHPNNEYYIKQKKFGKWYYVQVLHPGFYSGETEGSGVG